MVYFFRLFSKCFFAIGLTYAAGSCKAKGDLMMPAYNNYKFDAKVIEKLPLYDSLANAIFAKIPVFRNNIDSNEAYQAFRFMPASNEKAVFKKLPAEAGTEIDRYIAQLGKDFFYGFDIFKDSSIKIYVRHQTVQKTKVEIEENLSYYPVGKKMKEREYPIKDTVLDKHWQYWTRFDAPGLF